MLVHLRRATWWAAAALVVWLAAPAPARGQVAPANDGGAPVDAAVSEAGRADAAAAPAPAPAPPPSPGPSELATPAELSTAAEMTTTTALIGVPTPEQVEEPRPITRRLWFWMAITGVIVVGALVGVALYNPTTTRPECPSGYVCPP